MGGKCFYRGNYVRIKEDNKKMTCEHEFKIWFNEGSCFKFLESIKNCLQTLRSEYTTEQAHEEITKKINSKEYQNMLQNKFKDDPSSLF